MKPVNPNEILSRFKLARAGSVLALGLGLAAFLPIAAQAQYYGRGGGPYGYGGPYDGPYGPYGRYYGGPSPYDPDDVGPGPEPGPPPGPRYRADYGPPPGGPGGAGPGGPGPGPSGLGPSGPGPGGSGPGPRSSSAPHGEGPVSLEMIQGRIKAAGYRLIAPPRHKGNIYLAEVEDSKSIRHRLVYDANDGHLLENTPLGPVKKPGGPLPSETGKAPVEPAPAGGEPANQARSVPAPAPEAPPASGPHTDEPPPAPSAEGK